jgi:hypothetical protein
VVSSPHRCDACRILFYADSSNVTPAGSPYTQRIIALAVRLVVEDGLPFRTARWHLGRDHRMAAAPAGPGQRAACCGAVRTPASVRPPPPDGRPTGHAARLSRGESQLRALREIRDAVARLLDRRCRTAPAWAKRSRLRGCVPRSRRLGKSLDKWPSPNLEQALMFWDDALLRSTSKTVERGNRRHRKR